MGLKQELEALGHTVSFRRIDWSGRNRHTERIVAAQRIQSEVQPPEEGVQQFLIAHSHGGNACLLALKASELGHHIRGIACLSTPFLFFSRNLLATRLTTSWVVTVSLLSFLTPPIVLGGIFGFVVSVVGGSLVTGLLVTLVKRNRQRCEQRLEKLDGYELPSDVVVPLFIARTPGDEASGAIGASRLLNRLVSSAESPTARLVMKVAEDGRAVFIPVFLVTLLAIVLGALGLGVWVAIVLTVMLAPILLGLPVRIAIYGATFGLDLAGFALRYTLTTGPTPLGPTAKGDYRTLLVPLNEMPIAAHSQTYQNEVVWHEIARWAIERSAQQMAGKEG